MKKVKSFFILILLVLAVSTAALSACGEEPAPPNPPAPPSPAVYTVNGIANGTGYTMAGVTAAVGGVDYSFMVLVAPGYQGVPSVAYTVGGVAGANLTPVSAENVYSFTIPGSAVTGNIVIGAVSGISEIPPPAVKYAVSGIADGVGYTMIGATGPDAAIQGLPYIFVIIRGANFTGAPSVAYTVGGVDGVALTPSVNPAGTFTFTIPGASVTGDIVIGAVTGLNAAYTVTGITNGTGYNMTGAGTATQGTAYSFTITRLENFTGTPAVVYTVGGSIGAPLTPVVNPAGTFTFTIPGSSVTGNIVIGAVTGFSAVYTVTGIAPGVGYTMSGAAVATQGQPYFFVVTRGVNFAGTPSVAYTVGGLNGAPLTPAESPAGTFTFTIPGSSVTGDIEIGTVTGVNAVYTVTGIAPGTGYTMTGAATAAKGTAYAFTIVRNAGYKGTPAVTYTVNAVAGSALTPVESPVGSFTFTIPAVNGNIVIGGVTGFTEATLSERLYLQPWKAVGSAADAGYAAPYSHNGALIFDAGSSARLELFSRDIVATSTLVQGDTGGFSGEAGGSYPNPVPVNKLSLLLKADADFSLGLLGNGGTFRTDSSHANLFFLSYSAADQRMLFQRVTGVNGLRNEIGRNSNAQSGYVPGAWNRIDIEISIDPRISYGYGYGLIDEILGGGRELRGSIVFKISVNGKVVDWAATNGSSTIYEIMSPGHMTYVDNGTIYVQRFSGNDLYNDPSGTTRYGVNFMISGAHGVVSLRHPDSIQTFGAAGIADGAGYTMAGGSTATELTDYSFTVSVKSGFTGTPAVAYTVGGNAGAPLTPIEDPSGTFTFTIPGTAITGDIVIGAITGVHAVYAVSGITNGTGYTVSGASSAISGTNYIFTVTVATGYEGVPSVAYTIGGAAGSALTPVAQGKTYTFTIPGVNITGAIAIGAVSGVTLSVIHTVSGLGDFGGYSIAGDSGVPNITEYLFTVTVAAGDIPWAKYTVAGTAFDAEFVSSTAAGVFTFRIPFSAVTGNISLTAGIASVPAEITEKPFDDFSMNLGYSDCGYIDFDEIVDTGVLSATYCYEILQSPLGSSVSASIANGKITVKADRVGVIVVRAWIFADGIPAYYVDVTVGVVDIDVGMRDSIGISTAAQLQAIWTGPNAESRANLSKSYHLLNDIDFGGANIKPIGTQEHNNHDHIANVHNANCDTLDGWKGVFDGRGFALKNFTTISIGPDGNEGSNNYNNALFPGLSGGTIKNLSIINMSQSADTSRSALLVNSLYGGTIENVYINGTITAPRADDTWRRGGTVFGGTGDAPTGFTNAGLINPKTVIRNVVTNINVAPSEIDYHYASVGAHNYHYNDDGRRCMIYGVTGRWDNGHQNKPAEDRIFENIFVAFNNLNDTLLAGGYPSQIEATLFDRDYLTYSNFSALPGKFWNGNDFYPTELPSLKNLSAPTQVRSVTLSDSALSLSVTDRATLTATLAPAGAEINAITWVSSDPSVATVSNTGEIFAIKGGEATITAYTALGYSASCIVTVSGTQAFTVTGIGSGLGYEMAGNYLAVEGEDYSFTVTPESGRGTPAALSVFYTVDGEPMLPLTASFADGKYTFTIAGIDITGTIAIETVKSFGAPFANTFNAANTNNLKAWSTNSRLPVTADPVEKSGGFFEPYNWTGGVGNDYDGSGTANDNYGYNYPVKSVEDGEEVLIFTKDTDRVRINALALPYDGPSVTYSGVANPSTKGAMYNLGDEKMSTTANDTYFHYSIMVKATGDFRISMFETNGHNPFYMTSGSGVNLSYSAAAGGFNITHNANNSTGNGTDGDSAVVMATADDADTGFESGEWNRLDWTMIRYQDGMSDIRGRIYMAFYINGNRVLFDATGNSAPANSGMAVDVAGNLLFNAHVVGTYGPRMGFVVPPNANIFDTLQLKYVSVF